KTLLEYLIEEAAAHDLLDFTRDILLKKVNELKIYGWRYGGYVARLESLSEFFRHNMAVLERPVREDLFNPEHPIYTKVKDEAPARYGIDASVKNSLVADGCLVEGTVENSILFRGVHVAKGAAVKNCILMQATEVQSGAELSYVALDKGVLVRQDRRLAGYEGFPIIIRKGSVI
ncbi:MAG: glucose-1-phosphate adenylyltransferase subunit GlgD, partial [Clostridia bacterium]|nr:glucose-1-phosphate adenylyltransferase subunit GlgD [Clostridia bacterium]